MDGIILHTIIQDNFKECAMELEKNLIAKYKKSSYFL